MQVPSHSREIANSVLCLSADVARSSRMIFENTGTRRACKAAGLQLLKVVVKVILRYLNSSVSVSFAPSFVQSRLDKFCAFFFFCLGIFYLEGGIKSLLFLFLERGLKVETKVRKSWFYTRLAFNFPCDCAEKVSFLSLPN